MKRGNWPLPPNQRRLPAALIESISRPQRTWNWPFGILEALRPPTLQKLPVLNWTPMCDSCACVCFVGVCKCACVSLTLLDFFKDSI